MRQTADNYVSELSKIATKRNVIGYVFAINGKVNSADVYARAALQKALAEAFAPALLKRSPNCAKGKRSNRRSSRVPTPFSLIPKSSGLEKM